MAGYDAPVALDSAMMAFPPPPADFPDLATDPPERRMVDDMSVALVFVLLASGRACLVIMVIIPSASVAFSTVASDGDFSVCATTSSPGDWGTSGAVGAFPDLPPDETATDSETTATSTAVVDTTSTGAEGGGVSADARTSFPDFPLPGDDITDSETTTATG